MPENEIAKIVVDVSATGRQEVGIVNQFRLGINA